MLFPEADIYAYEPNPSALKWLECNAQDTRIKVSPNAVAEHSGKINLDTSFDSTLGRVSPQGDLEVDCIAACEVGEGRQIDLLKMDCEGSEWSILRDSGLLGRTRVFCLEYHLHNGHTFSELTCLIEKAGHKIISNDKIKNGGEFGIIHSRLI
jgi:FkbM family methyltransferase